MRGMSRGCVGLLVAILLSAGCATDEAPKRVDWGNEEAVTERAQSPLSGLKTQADFDARAATALSVVECEAIASGLMSSSSKSAAMMMRGCMRRSDFISLLYFSQAPWKAMKFTTNDLELVLQVALRRGGLEIAEDFQQLRLKVYDWQQFREEQKRVDDSFVTARVLRLDEKHTSTGYVSTVRVYGFDGGQSSYQTGGRYDYNSHRMVGGETRYYGKDYRNVAPVGITLQVRSQTPLPKERRVQIVARYDDASSLKLVRAQQEKAERNHEIVSSKDIAEREPLPEAVLDLVVIEDEVTASSTSTALQ